MLVEDAWNSWFHMSMHSKWLYRNVHKTHHDYTMTIGISAEHAHIVEYLWVNIGAVMIGPLILQDRMHLFVLLAWIAYRIGDTVD
jgi:sterol desaturase/sphingolipid hydroxylase (fatty acid hydroxylase superfamily)